MRHDRVIVGESHRLRPVELADAAFIHGLRTSPRAAFLHPTEGPVEAQERWIEEYFCRQGDYYFIVESIDGGVPHGTIGVYNVDDQQMSAEWGRWVLIEGSLAATESAMLVYKFGFDELGLSSMYCRTVLENTPVVSFHASFGLVTIGTEPDGPLTLVRQSLTKELWVANAGRIARLATRLAKKTASSDRRS